MSSPARRIIPCERHLLTLLLLLVIALPGLWVWPERGLTVSYYDNMRWRGEPVVTIESGIHLDRVAANATAFPQRTFAVRWRGVIRIDRPGTYTFETRSDDGSTLEIGSVLVVDNWGHHAERTQEGTIALDPGVHPIRVRYFQGNAAYSLAVRWTEPGGERSSIPSTRLFVTQPGPVLILLTRHVALLWGLSWLALALVGVRRLAWSRDGVTSQRLRMLGARFGLAVVSGLAALAVAEVGLRVVRAVQEERRELHIQLQESKEAEIGAGAQSFSSLRGLVQPSPHDGIVYELKPNLRGYFLGQELYTNARGLRDYEYSMEKPPDTVRIVGLGDSSLFGWGVPLEDSTLKVLERTLNTAASSTRFEVINFAVPGYNTAIETEVFLRKSLRYDPDVVLVNFSPNDYDLPNFMKEPEDYATLRTSYVFDLAYDVYRRWTGGVEPQVASLNPGARIIPREEAARLDDDPAIPDEYRYMVGTAGFERAMDKLVSAARAREIPVIVFDARSYPGLHPTYMRTFRDDQRELLERLSRDQGFHFLNTYPDYVDYLNAHPDASFPRVFSLSDTDSHPSVLAHAINAQALYDYLVAHGIVELDS